MFLPLMESSAPRFISVAWVTYALLVTLVVTYVAIWLLPVSEDTIAYWAVTPARIQALLDPQTFRSNLQSAPFEFLQVLGTTVTYQFFNLDFFQLFGNSMFLFVFGRRVEDAIGHLRYLLMLLLGGFIAALMHSLTTSTPELPVVGAVAGAAAVFAGYVAFHPRKYVTVLLGLGTLGPGIPWRLPARVFIGFYFVVATGLYFISVGPTAWMVTLGGLLSGFLLAALFNHHAIPIFQFFNPCWRIDVSEGRPAAYAINLDRAYSPARCALRMDKIPHFDWRPSEMVAYLEQKCRSPAQATLRDRGFWPATALARFAFPSLVVALLAIAGLDATFWLMLAVFVVAYLIWRRAIPRRVWGKPPLFLPQLDWMHAPPSLEHVDKQRLARGKRLSWIAATLYILSLAIMAPAVALKMVEHLPREVSAGPLEDWLSQIVANWVAIASPIGAIAILFAGVWAQRKAAQTVAIDASDLLRVDKRRPVVFLRSFHDDDLSFVEKDKGSLSDILLERILRRLTPKRRLEEVLAFIFRNAGPVVAIGKPGEPLPEMGFARTYVGDDDWQAKVVEWLNESAVIVVLAGASSGVTWELTEIARRGLLPRTVLLLPPLLNVAQSKGYADRFKRWNGLREAVPSLPMPASSSGYEIDTVVSIFFLADSRPVLLTSENHRELAYAQASTVAAYGALCHSA